MQKPEALQNLNPDLCFLCQKKTPERRVVRGREKFNLCKDCTDLVIQENQIRNLIKRTIYARDNKHIFQYTLGMDLSPTEIFVEIIESDNSGTH